MKNEAITFEDIGVLKKALEACVLEMPRGNLTRAMTLIAVDVALKRLKLIENYLHGFPSPCRSCGSPAGVESDAGGDYVYCMNEKCFLNEPRMPTIEEWERYAGKAGGE